MPNRRLGTLASSGSTFTIGFSATPAAGDRIVAVIGANRPVSSSPAGYTVDAQQSAGGFYVYVISRIADGSESAFSFTLSGAGNVAAAVYERVGCPQVLFAETQVESEGLFYVPVEIPRAESAGFVAAVAVTDAGFFGVDWSDNLYPLTPDWEREFGDTMAVSIAYSNEIPNQYAVYQAWCFAWEVDAVPFAVVGYGSPEAPPTAPPNLRATSVSGTSISVEWDASTKPGVSQSQIRYGVYLNGTRVVSSQTGRTYTFTGLTPGVTYTIEVDAVHNNLRSERSVLVVTTDGTPPSPPSDLVVTHVTPYSVTIGFTPATDNVGVAGYGAYVNGVKWGADHPPGDEVTVDGLEPVTTYVIGLDAVDAAGHRSPVVTVEAATISDQPPGPPSNLRATLVQGTAVTVAWDPASDDYAIVGYGVYLDGVKRGDDVQDVTWQVTGLERGTTYLIEVDAVDNIGQRSEKVSLEVTTVATTVPSIPANLTATPEGDTISLAWGPSVDDVRVVRYEVLLDGEVIGTTAGLAYVIEELIRGTTYLVQVRAVDDEEQRGDPATLTVKLDDPPWVPVASPVYMLGDRWAANVRDEHGVYWVVTREEGWSSSPPVTARVAEQDAQDGAFVGPGRLGSRVITLEGTADAPTREAMVAAQHRLTSVLPPRERALLRVEEAHMARQSYVRLGDQIEVKDRGALVFDWTLTLVAGDPRRYAITPVYAEGSADPESATPRATVTLHLAGDYKTIPGVITVFGPIRGFTIRHVELGLVIRAREVAVLPADDRYTLEIDLGTRLVWAYAPEEVQPEPQPARSWLELFPARFMLRPGTNTLILEGEPTGEDGVPRMAVRARSAWV